MTRDEALTILDMERKQAVEVILILAQKAERYDKEHPEVSPTTPSGMIPVYLKPTRGKRRKREFPASLRSGKKFVGVAAEG